MLKGKMENRLLEYFKLNSYEEIMKFMEENPEDKKVKELKELLNMEVISGEEVVEDEK